jgi:pseudaminic acid cytidylyltransferase
MNNLALIPARGGSKRIPKKNIKNFISKPVISFSIEAAVKSNLFNEVMVSTDDEEIAHIAASFGAKIPFFRSLENSNDYASTFDVVDEVISEYKKRDTQFDHICVIYPCAPFITEAILGMAYRRMMESNFDTVFPIINFNKPIQRALRIDNGLIRMVNPEFQNVRSQDLEPFYYDAGQFYWGRIERVLKNRSFYSENSGTIILNELNAHDIDTEEDWLIAESKFKLKQ